MVDLVRVTSGHVMVIDLVVCVVSGKPGDLCGEWLTLGSMRSGPVECLLFE